MVKLTVKLVTTLVAAVATMVLGASVANAAVADTAGVDRVVERPAAAAPASDPGATAWYYTITSSCGSWAGSIRYGANYWGGAVEGGGTPVYCQNSYITDCGSGAVLYDKDVHGAANVVGCNYGRGAYIKLYPGGVRDVALLAAHEFGHNWYDHTYVGCANWASWYDVMATYMC